MVQDDTGSSDEPSFKCPKCGLKFESQQVLDDHMITDHGVEDP